MAFKDVPVSKLEAPESRAVSGLWPCCRDVRRSLSSSPPSFCFQPVPPSLRLGWFRGIGGLGPFPVLPSSSCSLRRWPRAVLLWSWRCCERRWCSSLPWRLISAVTCWCPGASVTLSGCARLSSEGTCRCMSLILSVTCRS